MNSKLILGVRIDSLTLVYAIKKAYDFLTTPGSHTIFTPNPEMLVKASRDQYFKEVLNRGDFNVCDGFGISLVSWFRIKRIAGVDLMVEICRLAEEKGQTTVYLLGSNNQTVVQKTAAYLQYFFQELQIVGLNPGPKISESATGRLQVEGNASVLEDINEVKPDILFVAFGMGKQEKWIHENLPKLPSVKIAMGVGGAFDYLAGVVPRAPLLMRKCGLEWLYRLFKQPQRFGRIWNATVRFLFLVIKQIV